MQEQKLISVIVPVYMVEEYLDECIKSILNQTYKKIEVILIDDGSKDSSGKICDEYQKKDSRVRVIHQENKGLAAVRNLGIRTAMGEFIQFVDSDDWIDERMLEDKYALMQKYDADIVCSRVIRVNNKNSYLLNKWNYDIKIMNRLEALSVLFFPQYVDVITCNKLIKAELFERVIYPEGKLYEDMFTTWKIISNANRVLCINRAYYYYRINPESIGNRPFSQKNKELLEAVDECFSSCMQFEGIDKNSLIIGKWKWELVYVNFSIKSNCIDTDFAKSLQKRIKLNLVIHSDLLPWKNKIQFLIFKVSLLVYKRVFLFYWHRRYCGG